MASETSPCSRVAIALLHYPVYDKNHRVVATAVTNLDIHDIARTARTFGLARYYVVTPVPEQQELSRRIVRHWREGWGAGYNPKRKAALDLVSIVTTLDEAVRGLEKEFGGPVITVATGAGGAPNSVSYAGLGDMIKGEDARFLILLGTGWGLTPEVMDRADYILAPVTGSGSYNHLAVRSAAAIIIDRLLGDRAVGT
ncbi:MAG: RNA methyltransferase [Geobacteraceae bacterium]|nr:RNA methyltransferase [Geobacteraceae bacterium]